MISHYYRKEQGAALTLLGIVVTEVEVVNGFPEKPNFEDAVHVRIVNGSVYITINDVEQPLFDYATKTPAFTKGIIDKETVLKRQAGLFAALSAIEAAQM